MPSVPCPRCGAKLNVPEAALGKSGRCPKCQEKFLIQLPLANDPYDLAPLDLPASNSAQLASPLTSAPLSTPVASRPHRSDEDEPPRASAPWIIPAAIGGGLVSLLLLALAIWLGSRMLSGSSSTNAANARQSAAGTGAPVDEGSPLVVPPRPAHATSGPAAPVLAVPSADPATWNVTVDSIIAPEGLKSLIPLDTIMLEALAFSRADVAEAAVVERVHRADAFAAIDWVRCDLRQGKPIERIHLWREDTPRGEFVQGGNATWVQPWALSPSGERLAVVSSGKLWVYDRQGTRIAWFSVKETDVPTPWIGFAGEDAVWVRTKKKLRKYLFPEGKVERVVKEVLYSPVTMTSGGKYMLVAGEGGLLVLSSDDGSRAGLIPFPAGYGTGLPPVLNASGTKITAAFADNRANALFAVWDFATGKLERAIDQPYARTQRRLVDYRLASVGDQVLLVNHSFFHLGLGESIGDERRDHGIPVNAPPDGRLWQVRAVDGLPVDADAPAAAPDRPKLYLTAASMPPPAMQTVIQETGGFAWHPGISVNAVLIGVPGKHRDTVGAGFADWLARQGFGVDSKAKIKLEVTVKREADGQAAGNKIPLDQLTPAMREYLKTHPHEEWVELVTVKNLVIEGKVYDAQGKPAFLIPRRLVSRPIDQGANDDAVWQGLAAWKEAAPLPKTFFRDANGKRVYIPAQYIVPGVDGLVDAIIEPPQAAPFSTDDFKLPGE